MFLTVVFLLAAGCAAEHLATPAAHLPEPLAAFGRLPSIEDVALSPAGSRIALVRTSENERTVFILSLADRKVIGTLRAGDAKLRRIEWVDDDHLLVATSVTALPIGLVGDPAECWMLQLYDVPQRRVRPLMTGELVALDGEDHWLSRSATRLQMLEHVHVSLARNNPAE